MVINIIFFIVETKNKKNSDNSLYQLLVVLYGSYDCQTKHQPSHYGLHVEDE